MNPSIRPDGQYAREQGYCFQICTKAAKGKPWTVCYDEIASLGEAFRLIEDISAFECAVFVIKNGMGFLYWSSRSPSSYNHTAIYSEIR